MIIELEKHEVEYIDRVLYDKQYIYSNKDPIIDQIRNKLESAQDDHWNQYLLSKIT